MAAAVLAAVFCAACSGSKEPRTRGPEAAKRPDTNLEQKYDRELEELPKHAVAAANGAWHGKVEAAKPPSVTRADQAFNVIIDIGTEAAINCTVLDNPDLDPAGTLANLLKVNSDEVEYQDLVPLGASVAAGAPALLIEGLYTTGAPDGQTPGHLKMSFHARPDHPVLCVHDELGYRETFVRVAMDFSASLSAKRQVEPPAFHDVLLARLKDKPVGFVERTIRSSPGAARVSRQAMALALPRKDGKLLLSDEVSVQESDDADRIIKAAWASLQNGSLVTDVVIERQEANRYTAQGKVRGKPVQATFQTEDPAGLPGHVAVARLIREMLLSGRQEALSVQQYHPTVNPSEPITVTYETKGAKKLEVSSPAGEYSGIVDEHGLFTHAELGFGEGMTLELHRAGQATGSL